MDNQEHFWQVENFVSDLEHELRIEGVAEDNVPIIKEEIRSHLYDAVETQNPTTPSGMRKLLEEFGAAKKLARALANELESAKPKRMFLWPAALVAVVALLFALITFPVLPWPHHLWSGSIVLFFAMPVGLFLLGYRARRPLVGQFIALGAGWTIMMSLFWLATSVPETCFAGDSLRFQEAVRRAEMDSEIAKQQSYIDRLSLAARRLEAGQAYFNNPIGLPPADLVVGKRLLLPNGVRDQAMGAQAAGPADIGSLDGQADAGWGMDWKTKRYDGRTWAETFRDEDLQEINERQAALDSLKVTSRAPWPVQLAGDVRIAWSICLRFVAFAAVLTNLGWLAWFLLRAIRRERRRYRLGRNRLIG